MNNNVLFNPKFPIFANITIKTMQPFVKHFQTYDNAFDFMQMKNRAFSAANNSDIVCVVPGCDDNYAVVDLMTAIELGLGYVWSFSGWTANPFIQ